MTIVFDAATTSSNTASSTLTFAHTNGASADFLVVAVAHRRGVDDVSGVTYNGTAMARAVGYIANVGDYIYWLANPATGSNNVVVSVSAGTDRSLTATALSFSGIKALTPVDQTSNNNNDGTPSTLSTTLTPTVADSVIVAIWQQVSSSGDATLTPSNITEVADNYQSAAALAHNVAVGYKIVSGTSGNTFGWSSSISNQIDIASCNFTAAPTTTTGNFFLMF